MSMKVYCALITAQLGFGAYGIIVTKFAKETKADPLVFCLFRDAGAFPVMMCAAFLVEGKLSFPSLRSIPLLMVLGLTGPFIPQLLFLLGVYLTSANMAAMFQPAVPVWSAFLAMMTGVEPPPKLTTSHGCAKVFGILLAVCGAMTMTLGKLHDTSSEKSWLLQDSSVGTQFLGCICLFVKTSSTAVYYIIQKKYIFNQSHSTWKKQPLAVTAWSYFFATIFLAFASLTYSNQPEKFTSFTKETFYCLLYAIVVSSTMCYLLLSWCNMQAPSTLVTCSWPLQSLFCALLSMICLGQSLQILECAGGGLIISGLATVLWSTYKESEELRLHLKNEKTLC